MTALQRSRLTPILPQHGNCMTQQAADSFFGSGVRLKADRFFIKYLPSLARLGYFAELNSWVARNFSQVSIKPHQ